MLSRGDSCLIVQRICKVSLAHLQIADADRNEELDSSQSSQRSDCTSTIGPCTAHLSESCCDGPIMAECDSPPAWCVGENSAATEKEKNFALRWQRTQAPNGDTERKNSMKMLQAPSHHPALRKLFGKPNPLVPLLLRNYCCNNTLRPTLRIVHFPQRTNQRPAQIRLIRSAKCAAYLPLRTPSTLSVSGRTQGPELRTVSCARRTATLLADPRALPLLALPVGARPSIPRFATTKFLFA